MNDQNVFVTNIVTINAVDYRLTILSYDGTWWNVIKTATGEHTYLNADTVEQANMDNIRSGMEG